MRTRYVESATRCLGRLQPAAAEDDVLELAGLREVGSDQGNAGETLVLARLWHVERLGGVRSDHVARHEVGRAAEGDADLVAGPLARDEQAVDRHGAAAVSELDARDVLVAAQHALLGDDRDGVSPLGEYRLGRRGGLGLRLLVERVAEHHAVDDAESDSGHARNRKGTSPSKDAHARDFTILCNYSQYFSS